MSENIYGFDETTKEGSVSKFIQVTPETAIAEGRFIKELKFEENNGNPYFEVTVENKQGQTANQRWYEPKIGEFIKTDEDLKRTVTKFNGVTANLARRFLGENYKPQGVTDFRSLCKVIIKDIGSKYQGKELRIKLVLNKNNFPILPSYAPIFEDLSTNPSKLVINKTTKSNGEPFDKVISTYKKDNAKPDADTQAPATTADF